MSKQVLDVGNCGPDHATISAFLNKHFAVEIHQADQISDALEILANQSIDLVLVNRKLDIDYSDGLSVIESIKADQRFRSIPVMLITNYEEHQQAAISKGAERGFGKLQLEDPTTLTRLTPFLG